MTDPALTAALALDGVYMFGAVKIQLPSYTLCLLDGAGEVTFGGNTYLGIDPTFGTINSIDVLSERDGEEAPELLLSLLPKEGVATTTLANPAMQGSIVSIFVGVMDPATGLVIGVPEVMFLGEIDVPTITSSLGRRELEYTIVSVFERLFEVEEGVRASDGWHQSVWPGELGFQYMTGTDKNLYWGGKKPSGQTESSGFGGAAGGAAGIGGLQERKANSN